MRGAACCDHHDDDHAWTVSKNWILHVAFVHIQKTVFLCVFARKQIPLRKSKFCVFVFVAVCMCVERKFSLPDDDDDGFYCCGCCCSEEGSVAPSTVAPPVGSCWIGSGRVNLVSTAKPHLGVLLLGVHRSNSIPESGEIPLLNGPSSSMAAWLHLHSTSKQVQLYLPMWVRGPFPVAGPPRSPLWSWAVGG